MWETPIAEYLARLPEGDLMQPKRTTSLDIAIYALDFEEERSTNKDEPRGTPINWLVRKISSPHSCDFDASRMGAETG